MFNSVLDHTSVYLNFVVSVAALFALLYIGNKRPLWRQELVGVLTILSVRILFYGLTIHMVTSPIEHSHIVEISVTELSRLNSMLESFMFLSYASIWAFRVRGA